MPARAAEFFGEFLPAWFAGLGSTQQSSPGTLEFHVGGDVYGLRLVGGALQVERAPAEDALLRVVVSDHDFEAIVPRVVELLSQSGDGSRLFALRTLSIDPARAAQIRQVDGSVAFEIADGDALRILRFVPGAQPPTSEAACSVRLAAEDFWALQRGEKNPFELLMQNKIRIAGRADVAMALSSVLMT